MSLLNSLKELGWFISEDGLNVVGENGDVTDVKTLAKKALDFDLREIGAEAFPEEFTKDPSKLEQSIVVQIQKVRNVSAPKANEESKHAPRMLKLILTDGHTICTGVEITNIPSLNINTPPGTKLLLKSGNLQASHSILCLEPDTLSVLGGKVQHMIEKWELNRSLAKHVRGIVGADGGPPPWIPFGQRLEARDPQDKGFKSIQDATKQDNAEFEAQRKGAIAEAQRMAGVKKVFGGGTKPLLDANVQKIVDAGFTEEQAENALKYSKNNVDRALRTLQRRDGTDPKKDKPKEDKETREERPKRRGRNNAEEEVGQVKPSGKVSLFDFLEDKLPTVSEKEKLSRSSFSSNSFMRDFHKEERNAREADKQERHSASRDNRAQWKGRSNSKPDNDSARYNRSENNTVEHNRPDHIRQAQNRPDHNRHDNNQQEHNRTRRPQNYSTDSYHSNNTREERKPNNEKPPRFQRKDADQRNSERRQQNSSYGPPYPSGFSSAPPNSNHYQLDRGGRNQRGPRANPSSHTIDTLTEATANMNFNPNTQTQQSRSNRSQVSAPPPGYPVDQSYQMKMYTQNSNPPANVTFQRNNVQPEYHNTFSNNQMNGFIENPHIYPNMNFVSNQPNSYHNGRLPNYGYEQHQEISGQMPPGFVSSGIMGFQNAAVNEQARSLLGGQAEISWNIGDRCLALYWEDNTYYDAEVTGVSANTVVVKFSQYGNHEEVLKGNCIPSPNQNQPNRIMSHEQRPRDSTRGRVYVPPAQRRP